MTLRETRRRFVAASRRRRRRRGHDNGDCGARFTSTGRAEKIQALNIARIRVVQILRTENRTCRSVNHDRPHAMLSSPGQSRARRDQNIVRSREGRAVYRAHIAELSDCRGSRIVHAHLGLAAEKLSHHAPHQGRSSGHQHLQVPTA